MLSANPSQVNPFGPDVLEPSYYNRERRSTCTTRFRSPSHSPNRCNIPLLTQRPESADCHYPAGEKNRISTIGTFGNSAKESGAPMCGRDSNAVTSKPSHRSGGEENRLPLSYGIKLEDGRKSSPCEGKPTASPDIWESISSLDRVYFQSQTRKSFTFHEDSEDKHISLKQLGKKCDTATVENQTKDRDFVIEDWKPKPSRIQRVPKDFIVPGVERTGRKFSIVK